MKCPKKVMQNHTRNPLILQAEQRANMLAEKASFAGHISDREKLHVFRRYLISVSRWSSYVVR